MVESWREEKVDVATALHRGGVLVDLMEEDPVNALSALLLFLGEDLAATVRRYLHEFVEVTRED